MKDININLADVVGPQATLQPHSRPFPVQAGSGARLEDRCTLLLPLERCRHPHRPQEVGNRASPRHSTFVRSNRFSLLRSSSRRRSVSMPAARRMTRQLPSLRKFMPINDTRMDVGKHSYVRRLRHPRPNMWPSYPPCPNPNIECLHVTPLDPRSASGQHGPGRGGRHAMILDPKSC